MPSRLFAPALAVALLSLGAAPTVEGAGRRPPPPPPEETAAPAVAPLPPVPQEAFALGVDVLEAGGFAALRGRRVGLLTHPAGVNARGESTVDVLRRGEAAGGFRLVALFGPEHGIYGDEKADVPVPDRTDTRTGLPVWSLYGPTRKPTPTMLAGLDALVVDLQDIGVRSYTYASALRWAMEACFERGVEVVVLDRPNPLGGLLVDGPPLEDRWRSYVGAYPVPYVHGLTIGELARLAAATPGVMAVAEDVRLRGRLTVVPLRGWRRAMFWPETGLRFVATSPNVPDLSAVAGYAMTGLGAQLGGFRHGIGTAHPFRLLNFRGRAPEEVAAALRAEGLPGLAFDVVTVEGARGPERGVFVRLTDWTAVRPTALSFAMMTLAAGWSPANPFAAATNAQADLFNKHVGSTAWWAELTVAGGAVDYRAWTERWHRQALAWRDSTARRFWLYPE